MTLPAVAPIEQPVEATPTPAEPTTAPAIEPIEVRMEPPAMAMPEEPDADEAAGPESVPVDEEGASGE